MNQRTDVDPALRRAIELHQLGRLEEAESSYRGVIARDPGNAQSLNLLGVLLVQSHRADEAVPLLERAAACLVDDPDVHANLARAHHALGHPEQAVPWMRRAARLAPDSARIQSDLGAILQTVGRVDEARTIYEQQLERHPQHITSRYNLATIAHQQHDLDRAVDLLESVVGDHPRHPKFRTVLAGYLLEAGRVDDALGHCDAALAANPSDLMAMTLKTVALARRGEHEAARRLMDLDALVTHDGIELPPGWASLEDFNAALERHVLAHPTLMPEPRRNATRNGRHTGNLLRDADKGPMQDLERIIRRRVEHYLDSLPREADHPFLARRPRRWRLQAWAVVMHRQGHQLAHTHPDGWVSGVYYVRVPRCVSEHDSERAGWIEFGRPLPELSGESALATRSLRPREGLMVVFPSFVYHETVAFDSDEHRISIAFDAVPA